jgi:hypothetical protein
MCLNRTLVCVVKTSALSTTVKTFEPIDQTIRGKNKPTFRKLLQGGNDTLRLFKVGCFDLSRVRRPSLSTVMLVHRNSTSPSSPIRSPCSRHGYVWVAQKDS